ncbi:MAG: PP2C family serine/threonine-protein phosphatase [Pyrinomonadaceae bacterium]
MWEYANVSVKGTSHEATGIPCQDSNDCLNIENDICQTFIAVVSDGAGSATKAEFGSKFICEKFITDIKKGLENKLSVKDFTHDFFRNWIANFRQELQIQAETEGLQLRNFACTFLGAIIGETSACFVQIGDGAIVMKGEEGGYNFIFLPQQGQFVNQTFFVTHEKAIDHLEFDYLDKTVNEIALFSDGIQNLVLDFQTLAVNEDFFSDWFQWLREIQDRDKANQLLNAYLNSSKINERTDDDKTLILAVRKSLPNRVLHLIE